MGRMVKIASPINLGNIPSSNVHSIYMNEPIKYENIGKQRIKLYQVVHMYRGYPEIEAAVFIMVARIVPYFIVLPKCRWTRGKDHVHAVYVVIVICQRNVVVPDRRRQVDRFKAVMGYIAVLANYPVLLIKPRGNSSLCTWYLSSVTQFGMRNILSKSSGTCFRQRNFAVQLHT